jgi:hypothetical protein
MEMNAFFIHKALAMLIFKFSEAFKWAGLQLTAPNVKEGIYARQKHFSDAADTHFSGSDIRLRIKRWRQPVRYRF